MLAFWFNQDQVYRLRSMSLAAVFREGESCIDEAIDCDRQALELHPPGHPERAVSLIWLADHLNTRYSQLGRIRDLEEVIVLQREALDLHQEEHPDRLSLLASLANKLTTRHDQLEVMEDLEEAIVLYREALRLHPEGHPDRSLSLNNLAICLRERYTQLRAMRDLDEAIVLHRKSLALRPEGCSNRSISLNNLANSLADRHSQLGIIEDLNEAILLAREALDLRPEGHPARSRTLVHLANHLAARNRQLGAMDDLHEALALSRAALDLCPQGHPDRSHPLMNLVNRLSACYNELGVVENLDEAIVLDREILDLIPEGHRERPTCLSNFADHLASRFRLLGVMEDLEEAIILGRKSLDLRLKGHPSQATSLCNLAIHLAIRYDQLGVMEDLDEAIVLSRTALDFRPKGHPRRSTPLNSLANHLATRYNRLGVVEDLNEGISIHREALGLLPQGHPDRSTSLNNIAVNLVTRYKQLGNMKDLDEAILLNREAFKMFHSGHPYWSNSLDQITKCLRCRLAKSCQLEDKEDLFRLYTQLAQELPIVSAMDISVAKEWIHAAEEFHHPSLILAYETSLRLLAQHFATLPSLPKHHAILKNLTSSLAVDAFSACLRNRSPTKAAELVEQGRGVFWSQLTRLRSPLDDVITSGTAGKDLADDFGRLASHIHDTINSHGPDQHGPLWHLNLEMRKVVRNIRKLPGLSRFLLPLLFPDLRRAAIGGPVIIINASQYSCDALVVLFCHDPVHIPLQTTLEGVRDLSTELHTLTARATTQRIDITRQLAALLRKLWDQIVSPIVDFLRTIHPPGSRIWWCPTSEFSSLPLHAAGPFRKGQKNLPNLYISSYTPTLTALIYARQHDPSAFPTGETRFVAIGQAKAVGTRELRSVRTELDHIGRLLCDLTAFTRIDGEESCIDRVIEKLGQNEWAHFACHGLPNRAQPFESAFALHDGRLTIERIIGCKLKNPKFAYLSACHTTVGDKESPDEVIHLASALQFLGFRSVIGTMWAVDDGETNKITSSFYKYMMDESGRLDHTRAAFALNETMRSVRIPLDQRILYVHLGA